MTTSAAEPTTVPGTLAGDLVLARLLPQTKQAPAPARVRADVARFFRDPLSDERWQDTIDGLIHTGLLMTRPLRLTDSGRSHALAFLGTPELPPRCHWGTIQAKFLVPKALGLAPTAQETRKKIEKTENLAALLLKRRFDLAVGPSPAFSKVLEALACRELGFPEATSLDEIQRLVLSRMIRSEEILDADTLKKNLPWVLLGAKPGILGLRGTLLDGWADGAEEPILVEFDLPAFARTVMAAARDCPTGRFGENKVFISHVWRQLRDEPGFPAMDLPTFKERLTEANAARLLTLSRADLVAVMDSADVRESQTRYLNSEFHFVLLEEE